MKIRLGTRGSTLARWQADWVAATLRQRQFEVEQVLISTQGDQQQAPIGNLGSQGVFTKEIQRALLEDRIDLAVHSLKDLPTDPVPGLALAAVPQREACGDALISAAGMTLDELPEGARVGTGSLRRQTQLLHYRPELVVRDIRGNIDTRLKKLDDGDFDAIILAEAGLRRLDLADRITQLLPKAVMLPAVGQGALGLETRSDDPSTLQAVAPLNDPVAMAAVTAERALLATLRGGCLAPVGAWARVQRDGLRLDAAVLSRDGRKRIAVAEWGPVENAAEMGRQVAERLIAAGASELIAASRDHPA